MTVSPGGAGDNVVRLDVGVDIGAGQQVTIDIYGVANPTTAAPGTLQVSTSSDTTADSLSLPTAAESGPGAVSATESDSTPGASNVTYTASLTATHGLTSDDPDEDDGGVIGSSADPVSAITLSAPGATFPSDPSGYSIEDVTTDTTFEPANVTLLDAGGAVIDIGDSPSDDVSPGDQLVVTVTGVTNASGNVGISSVSTSSDPGTVAPPVPTNVSATAGNASATVSWAAATGLSGVTGYVVTPYIGSTPQSPYTTSGTGTTADVAGLTNGTAYTFTVAAITAAGTGTASAHSPAVTPTLPSSGAPAFGESTADLDFGAIGVGITSPASTIKVTNTGSAALSISGVALAGTDAKEFAISSDGCAGQSLASAASCTVSVTFTPSSASTQSASLTFTDNASDSPQSIVLSGSGTKLGSVSGTVTDGSGKGLSGVSLSICPEGANGIELGSSACVYGTSGVGGGYQLSGLVPGKWDLQAQPASSDLFPGSAIVSVQPGDNTENFTLSAPQPLPSGYTFDGVDGVSTSGVPSANWYQPFSFTFPYSLAAGEPNTETVLLETAVFSPTGSTDGDQPSVSGSVVVLVSYDASDKATVEGVYSDPQSGPDPQITTTKASSSIRRLASDGTPAGSGPVAVAANGDLTTNIVLTQAGAAMVSSTVAGMFNATVPGQGGDFHGGAQVTTDGKTAYDLPPGSSVTITKDGVTIAQPNKQPIMPLKTCPPTTSSNLRRHTPRADAETCPVPPPPPGGFDEYHDPGGTVKTTAGAPVPGARVTLSRTSTRKGKLSKVPNGSSIMSPANRRNPSVTTASGLFSWDTLPGFYEIAAQRSGCKTTSRSTSKLLQVPPPALGIGLVLRCPHLTRASTKVKISAKKLAHSKLVELIVTVGGNRRHVPTGDVKLSIDGRGLVTTPLGRRGTLTWDANASTTKSVGAVYDGDGYNKSSRASTKVK